MRQYMFNHNVTITISSTQPLTLQSNTDEFIMDLKRLKRYDTREQMDINLVRIYLQATTLAYLNDFTDYRCISDNALNGLRSDSFTSNLGWARQTTPSETQIRLWKQYTKPNFIRSERYWRTRPTARPFTQSDVSDTPEEPKLSLTETIRRLPKFQRRMLMHVKQHVTDDQAWQACNTEAALTFASDGGQKDQQGTFGWLISSSTNEVLYEGAGPVNGLHDSASSTRSELGGYAAVLLFYRILLSMWDEK